VKDMDTTDVSQGPASSAIPFQGLEVVGRKFSGEGPQGGRFACPVRKIEDGGGDWVLRGKESFSEGRPAVCDGKETWKKTPVSSVRGGGGEKKPHKDHL